MARLWMDGQFAWMLQEKEDVPGEDSIPVATGVDSEVDTTVTGATVTGATVTGAMVTGATVIEAVATSTGIAEVVVVVAAMDTQATETTAMVQTSKHHPDSRSSRGWLYFKDALLKKNVHVLLLTLVLLFCCSISSIVKTKCGHEFWSFLNKTMLPCYSSRLLPCLGIFIPQKSFVN